MTSITTLTKLTNSVPGTAIEEHLLHLAFVHEVKYESWTISTHLHIHLYTVCIYVQIISKLFHNRHIHIYIFIFIVQVFFFFFVYIQNVAKCKNRMKHTFQRPNTFCNIGVDRAHCTVLVMEVDFIRCFNCQSWININTDIIILTLHQWPPFSAPGYASLPSAGWLGGQWLASQASEVSSQIGKFHLEPQTKFASL